jgi:hypothetical protein
MKILIASTPATGHLNPLLAIGRILIAEGHQLAFLSGSVLRSRIEAIGAEFHALPEGADFDLRDIGSVAPELKSIAPGPDWLRVALERVFVDTLPAQHQGLQQVLRRFPAEIVIGDDMFFGVLPNAARTAVDASSHRALRHVVSALVPARRRTAFRRPAARHHEAAARRLRGDLS